MKWENNKLTNSDEYLNASIHDYGKASWLGKRWGAKVTILGKCHYGREFNTEKEAKDDVELFICGLVKKLQNLRKIGK